MESKNTFLSERFQNSIKKNHRNKGKIDTPNMTAQLPGLSQALQ